MPKSLVLCEGPKSARDCEQISKLLVEKRLTNANSDAPPGVHQLSVATCQPAAGGKRIFDECRRGSLQVGYLSTNSTGKTYVCIPVDSDVGMLE